MLRMMFGLVLLAMAVFAPLIYAGPQLFSDLSVGQNWQLAEDLDTKESKCTRYYFLVSTCNIEYVNRRDPTRVGGSLNYLVLGSWSGEQVVLLRSRTDPDRIGTTVGVEHMTQRIVSFAVFVLVALGYMALLLKAFVFPTRSDEPAMAGATVDAPAPRMPSPAQGFGRRATRPS